MPELPEVEILKEELRREAVGRRVKEVGVFEKKEGQFPVAELREAAEGRAIVGVRRRGKMLVLDFEGGHSLIIHLMMVGQLLLSPPFAGEARDVCLELKFADGTRLTLGQVRLKYVHLLPSAEVDDWPPVAKLGVDPLDESFTVDLFSLRPRRIPPNRPRRSTRSVPRCTGTSPPKQAPPSLGSPHPRRGRSVHPGARKPPPSRSAPGPR